MIRYPMIIDESSEQILLTGQSQGYKGIEFFTVKTVQPFLKGGFEIGGEISGIRTRIGNRLAFFIETLRHVQCPLR